MKEVTDPELLKQLEGDNTPQEVTDPALLAQLEGGEGAPDPHLDPLEYERSEAYPPAGITGGKPSLDIMMAPKMAMDAYAMAKALPAAGRALANAPSAIREGIADWLAQKAQNQAIKAAGATTSNLEQMGEALGGPEGIRKAGQYMLDKKIITPGASAEQMLPRVNELKSAAGARIGEARATGSARALEQGKVPPTPAEIEKEIRARLGDKYGSGVESGQAGDLEKAITEIGKVGENPTYPALFDTSTRINAAAKSARQLNQPSGAMSDAANILSRQADDSLRSVLSPEEAAAYAADKAEFGVTKSLGKIMDRTQYRDMGGANTVPMSKLGLVSRGVNWVAPHTRVAVTADRISKALRSNPEIFGKNAPMLAEAAQKGAQALGVATYMLQQRDPEFREMIRSLSEEQ